MRSPDKKSHQISDEVLRSMTRTNPALISTEMGFKLGIYQATLDNIKMLGTVSKLSIWFATNNGQRPRISPGAPE
ncbi:hypothetical protein TNCV_3114491 [Trichonephila clavipes]|nr:hypothetical protein TNCV_3114491 [Trichonephila clavipes]